MPVVRLKGIEKSYPLKGGEVHALKGVDLTLQRGEICALVGSSGSGKTTLLNLLGCLDVPSAGSYELDGIAVCAADASELAQLRAAEIGFVFQSFNLISVLSAYENIELALLCEGSLTAKERRYRVLELLNAVGLSGHAKHRPDELSGGQKQRVALARALAPRPRLLLADEPTASLDGDTASQMLEVLVELNRREGTTVLISTHDPRVLPFVHRVVEMADGRIRPSSAAAMPHSRTVLQVPSRMDRLVPELVV
jgi:putative ABC transport system ATP-binding protein